MAKAKFGWTVVRNTDASKRPFKVYERDCPADEKHFAADLAPFTHPTKTAAIAAGDRGEYAYKR
jgi:hypothetical protein